MRPKSQEFTREDTFGNNQSKNTVFNSQSKNDFKSTVNNISKI